MTVNGQEFQNGGDGNRMRGGRFSQAGLNDNTCGIRAENMQHFTDIPRRPSRTQMSRWFKPAARSINS